MSRKPPWIAGPDTLRGMDEQFWDWMAWLVSKREKGLTGLLNTELRRMSQHLLRPMGVPAVPESLAAAVAGYLRARGALERRYGIQVRHRLGEAVRPLVGEPPKDRQVSEV